jgi:hypothetical protein
MKAMHTHLFLVAATVSGAAVLAQKDERGVQDRQPPHSAVTRTPDFVFLDDVLGAKVVIQPGAEARREAAEENDKVKRPSGEIKDLILDCRSGNIESAVISFGGLLGIGDKTVALPATLLTWNPANKSFDLMANEDQLKSLSAFDLKEARKRGLDNEVVVLRTSWTRFDPRAGTEAAAHTGRPVEAASGTTDKGADPNAVSPVNPPKGQESAKQTTVVGTTFVVVPGRYMVASEVDDYPVYALGEKFGKVDKCIIDRNARSLVFCVVSHGGALGVGDTEYLIPHRQMTLCRDGDDQLYCINKTVEQLKTSVKYEKPKHGAVLDAETAKRAESMN